MAWKNKAEKRGHQNGTGRGEKTLPLSIQLCKESLLLTFMRMDTLMRIDHHYTNVY